MAMNRFTARNVHVACHFVRAKEIERVIPPASHAFLISLNSVGLTISVTLSKIHIAGLTSLDTTRTIANERAGSITTIASASTISIARRHLPHHLGRVGAP
jgi:hypothetical protein